MKDLEIRIFITSSVYRIHHSLFQNVSGFKSLICQEFLQRRFQV